MTVDNTQMPREMPGLAVLLHSSLVIQCLSMSVPPYGKGHAAHMPCCSTPVLTCDSCLNAWVLFMFGSYNKAKKLASATVLIHARQMCMQNPDDKRVVICDDVLRRLTGKDKFLAFGAQKHFAHHILK